MHDLKFFRPDYVVQRGDTEERCPEAHRVVRNAVAVAEVLRTFISSNLLDALTAIERAETPVDGDRTLTPHDAMNLAAVLEEANYLLDTSLDREWHPRGPAAKYILDEAARPFTFPDGRHDLDRVFEITREGRVTLQSQRIPLADLLERLPQVAAFLRRAGGEETWSLSTTDERS